MSRRVFYIVHLDKGRIAALSFFGAGLLLTAFATGYRFAPQASQASPESADISLLDSSSPDSPDAARDEGDVPAISLNDERRDGASNHDDESPAENRDSDDRREPKRERVNLLDSAMPAESSTRPERKESPDNRSEKRREEKKPVKKEKRTKENVKKETVKKEKKQDKPATKITEKKNTEKEAEKRTASDADAPAKTEKVVEKQSVYVLQMGAYQSREAALRLSEQIRKHGISTYVRKTGKIHTVRTDGTTNREELFRLEKKLKSLNFSPVTVRIQDR